MALIDAVNDPELAVKRPAIDGLGILQDDDVIPILQQLRSQVVGMQSPLKLKIQE